MIERNFRSFSLRRTSTYRGRWILRALRNHDWTRNFPTVLLEIPPGIDSLFQPFSQNLFQEILCIWSRNVAPKISTETNSQIFVMFFFNVTTSFGHFSWFFSGGFCGISFVALSRTTSRTSPKLLQRLLRYLQVFLQKLPKICLNMFV